MDSQNNPRGLEPDLVILDADVITCDPDNPRAEAVAVHGGRIGAVGTSGQVRGMAGPRTRVIEAGGKTLTPGFIDAHMHPRAVYPDIGHRMHVVDLFDVCSMDDLIRALQAKAAVTPAGEWIQGRGYHDTRLGRHPTRDDLDRVSTAHPISITHSSLHLSAVNSLVLERAGIGTGTPDPDGGAYDRDPGGRPSGVCRESAMRAARDAAGIPLPAASPNEEKDGLAACLRNFLRRGITSIADAGAYDQFGLYLALLEEGRLPVRVTMMVRYEPKVLEALETLRLRTGFGDDRLKLGPLKLFAGNSLSGRTCWLSEPYVGSHRDDDPPYFGIPHPVVASGALAEIILAGHRAGFQWAIHANGDRDIEAVLDAFEAALRQLPRSDHRHRIEHCSIVGQDTRILQRIRDLGVIPVFHEYTYEHGDKYADYGEERIAMMHAYRSALDLGIRPAAHSDWPVSAADPMTRIQSMVTRRSAQGVVYGPRQKVSPEEALDVWTMGNARTIFEERTRGSIRVGKLADLVLLSGDPRRVNPEEIKDIQVEKTIVNGVVAHERESRIE